MRGRFIMSRIVSRPKNYDEYLTQEVLLATLLMQARGGDAAAIDELHSYAHGYMTASYRQHETKGRTPDKKKEVITLTWAMRAARLQLKDKGKINPRTLTTDTVELARVNGVTLAERTTRQIIKKNIDSITLALKK